MKRISPEKTIKGIIPLAETGEALRETIRLSAQKRPFLQKTSFERVLHAHKKSDQGNEQNTADKKQLKFH